MRKKLFIEITEYYNLSSMTNLRRLRLHKANHPAVPRFLRSIQSPHLSTIVFNISVMFIRELKPKDYVEVDEAFNRPIFASLQTVLFIYTGQLWVERLAQKLKLLFPSLAKRDLIKVTKDNRPKVSDSSLTCLPEWC